MTIIEDNLDAIRKTIHHAASIVNRDASKIRLIAVSKTKPVEALVAAYDAGQKEFGENYVQEGCDKVTNLKQYKDITWHFIGPIQSNKTKDVAHHFHWVHTISREKIAQRLNDQRPSNMPPINVCIQVNLQQEATKAGVTLEQIKPLAEQIQQMPNLRLRGLMAIPKPSESEAETLATFQAIQHAFLALQSQYPSVDTLSLGMSSDIPQAIASGSTMVRVGTAIFGKRN